MSAATLINNLGIPSNWSCRSVEVGDGFAPSGIAKTENPNVAVVHVKSGMKALCSRCPHRGKDLTVHGRLEADEIRCVHFGHSWSVETGEPTGIRNTGGDGAIKFFDVIIDKDGTAYTSGEVTI